MNAITKPRSTSASFTHEFLPPTGAPPGDIRRIMSQPSRASSRDPSSRDDGGDGDGAVTADGKNKGDNANDTAKGKSVIKSLTAKLLPTRYVNMTTVSQHEAGSNDSGKTRSREKTGSDDGEETGSRDDTILTAVDRGSNIGILDRKNIQIIDHPIEPNHVNVVANDNQSRRLPLVTGAAVATTDDKTDIIMIFKEYALGDTTVHSCLQLEDNGIQVHDTPSKPPEYYDLDTLEEKEEDTSGASIILPEGYTIPLIFKNGLAYLQLRKFTAEEFETLPHVTATRPGPWDPSKYDFTHIEGESRHDFLRRALNQTHRLRRTAGLPGSPPQPDLTKMATNNLNHNMVPVLKFKNTIEKVGKTERELTEMEKNGKRAANIPINHDEAMDMDEKEGNDRWAEAEREEMNRLEFYGLLDGRYDYTEPQAFEWSYSKRSDGTYRARLMVEESEYAINRTILTPSMKSMSPIDDRTSIITSTAPILAIETQDCVPDHPYRSTFDRVIDSLRELVHEAERECKLIEKTFGYKVREEPLSFWFSNMDTIHDARLMTKTYRQELEELHDKPKSSTRTKLNLRRKFGMFVYDFMNYHLVLLPVTYKESSTYTPTAHTRL